MSAKPAPAAAERPNSLGATIEKRVARHSTRKYDWDALKFQADLDPKYRRAQIRYVGTGGTGVGSDVNTAPPESFTFSPLWSPAGHDGPPHRHAAGGDVFLPCCGRSKGGLSP